MNLALRKIVFPLIKDWTSMNAFYLPALLKWHTHDLLAFFTTVFQFISIIVFDVSVLAFTTGIRNQHVPVDRSEFSKGCTENFIICRIITYLVIEKSFVSTMSFTADYRTDSLGRILTPAQNPVDVNGASCVIKNRHTRWACKIRALKQSFLNPCDLKQAAEQVDHKKQALFNQWSLLTAKFSPCFSPFPPAVNRIMTTTKNTLVINF